MAYVITNPCVDVKDKACTEVCPADCIYEGERTMYINPEECVECGACEASCPTGAIFYEEDLPEGAEEYYDIAVKFFEESGANGGAAAFGPVGHDEPRIAAL